jgi:hypothetical protein
MPRVVQESEANQFEGIATDDKIWFRYSYLPSKMLARSPAKVIPMTGQVIGAKKTIITLFVTARQLILLDVRPKCHKYNQQYFVGYLCPDGKR